MKILSKSLLVVLLFVASVSFSQQGTKDTMFLMNGRIVPVNVIDTLFQFVTFTDPDDSTKRAHVDIDALFAIKYKSGDIFYYYEQDTITNFFTRDEMWMFMQGERDARKGFKPYGSLYGTAAAGIVGGLTGSLFAPLAPLVYFSMVGLPWVRIKHKTVSNANYLTYDSYILGYEREARRKRRIQSLIGGVIGLAIGFAGYAIYEYYPYSYALVQRNGGWQIIQQHR
ncbi:MAG: hypothetical protein ACXVC6_01455 [Bacteroidia bacterium]